MRLLVACALLGVQPSAARAEKAWIVVGASSPSANGIARAARPLAAAWPRGLVFHSADCGEKRDVFGWAYRVAGSADDARAVLPAAREIANGAYVKASIAADQLLHKVLVFDGTKPIASVSSCRKPRWTGPASLVCSAESVNADGKIELATKKVPLGR